MSGPGAVPGGPPRSVRISGWGSYVPERVLSNADLERLVDTSDEWIRTRTGIRERRVAAPHETTATLAATAANRARRYRHHRGRDAHARLPHALDGGAGQGRAR